MIIRTLAASRVVPPNKKPLAYEPVVSLRTPTQTTLIIVIINKLISRIGSDRKGWERRGVGTVSYTHLTLPTIYSV